MQTTNSYSGARACTPSDSTVVTCHGIYVGGAGAVAIKTESGAAAVTLAAVPVGTFLPINITEGRVMATNTTATNLVIFD